MTDKTKAPERRVTFGNETPETSDVVLCNYCGESLHDVEHGVFWEQTRTHYCEPAKDKRIAELEAKLAKAVDALTVVDLLDPEGATSLCSHPALTSIVLRMGATARKTLAELKGTTQ